jgi:hypothetical protein
MDPIFGLFAWLPVWLFFVFVIATLDYTEAIKTQNSGVR